MPLSWNEIRQNAIRFARDWSDASREDADAKSFWDEFFAVFGIRRRTVASFEAPVKSLSGQYNYIDLFWRGVLLVEHKSRGKDLGKAESQAFSYIQDLKREGRDEEIPRYIILSDFARIALHDLEPDDPSRAVTEISLADFHQCIHQFAFIPGYKQHTFEDQDPINIQAVAVMGELHDALEAGGYTGHDLERFLVRILFCLFADDTGIFERDAFHLYLENHTREDGLDLGPQLAQLFAVLNTPDERRQKNLDEDLAAFRYVNGALFDEQLGFAAFNRNMRSALLRCTRFDWSRISPAIFGSLFQAVMEPRERRQIGGHYTSERDILKVIRSLFLDDLRAEFERSKTNKAELRRFREKLGTQVFFDPACGCGNFLVITYRELRLLETQVLKALYGRQQELDIQHLSLVDVDAFHGIEILEWPARIAEVAMWLMDHVMNLKLSEEFGRYFVRLPLRKSPHIVCGNALRIDWKTVVAPDKCSYILGNPPFVGKHLMTKEQGEDMQLVWGDSARAGVLDYVTAWYRKAAEFVQGTRIVVGFVSTNSISQGEQVGALWMPLFQRFGLKIHFAHRTFQWESEARGKAHVHVVIIGFAAFDRLEKKLYEYAGKGEGTVTIAKNISPYLFDGTDLAVDSRAKSLCQVPACEYGNKPTDGGFLIIEEADREAFLKENPGAKQFLRPLLCAEEYLHGIPRWCLWLVDVSPVDIGNISGIRERVQAVRDFRMASKKEPTRRKADEPSLFAEIRQPKSRYIVIPRHSSENRRYIPFGYFEPEVILHDSCSCIPDATLYHFGVLSSSMHMAWVRQVAGRLKSDYRYSNKLVYNNFPWPESLTEKQKQTVEEKAQAVLDVRASFVAPASRRLAQDAGGTPALLPEHAGGTPALQSTLADLYDPLTMPPALVKAHAELDRAVDACYRAQPFTSERQRVEYLFELYEKLSAPLANKPAKAKTAQNDHRVRP